MSIVSYSEIEEVSFRIAGDEDIKRTAAVEVRTYELFSGEKPVPNGCFDAHMGTTDYHINCATCGHQRKEDLGHPGFMRSKVDLISPLFISEIRRWLNVICFNCGSMLIEFNKIKKEHKRNRLLKASKSVYDNVVCPICETIHYKIKKSPDDYFSLEVAEKPVSRKLTTQEIKDILGRISDKTVEMLGRDYHPSKLIISNILIPPNTIRPGVKLGYGEKEMSSHHDLTTVVQALAKANMQGVSSMEKSREEISADNLQLLLYALIIGTSATSKKRSLTVGNRVIKSITQGLPKKEGRIRKNLLGKRTCSIGRSTISNNNSLPIWKVGCPLEFARKLQIWEVVQEYNINTLLQYFLNGDKRYPGCSRIVKGNAEYRVGGGIQQRIKLEIGDKILRDLVTGDLVYINRQPSSERSSIGVHTVVVIEDPTVNTLQLNVDACSAYGADFDGDEMSIYPPQNPMTRAEAGIISSVEVVSVSTKDSSPIFGLTQDSVVGSYMLSREEAMDKLHAMRYFANTNVDEFPDFSDSEDIYTGRQLISKLLSKTPINYTRKSVLANEALNTFMEFPEKDKLTVIERGILKSGVLGKDSLSAKANGGIFHLIIREYGARKSLNTIFALQQMSIDYLSNRGLTISAHDMILPEDTVDRIHQIVNGMQKEANLVSEKLIRREIIPPIGQTTHEYYEKMLLEMLKTPPDDIMLYLSDIDEKNNGLFNLIISGSKGKLPNANHIMAVIGQHDIDGHRMPEGLSFKRTIAYFPRFSTSIFAYGFDANNYISGLSSDVILFAYKSGRFDLINKALTTASTGYQNRKGIKAAESAIVDHYRRVVLGTKVIQYIYGEDGIDTRNVERVKLRTVFMSDNELLHTCYDELAESEEVKREVDIAYGRIVEDRNFYRGMCKRTETYKASPMENTIQTPVNIARLIDDVKISRGEGSVIADDEQMLYNLKKVEKLCSKIPYLLLNRIQEKKGTKIPPHMKAATKLFRILIRSELNPKTLRELSPSEVKYIVERIKLQYSKSLIEYGTAVGVLAGQAIFEQLTQYMLDSHHRSVSGGTSRSSLSRVTEIFGAKSAEAELAPQMTLRVKPEFEHDRLKVIQIANHIEYMNFHTFVAGWDLLFEPFGQFIYPPFKEDEKWFNDFIKYHPLSAPPGDLTNWCIRVEIAKIRMFLKGVSLATIVERIQLAHPMIYVTHTAENVKNIVIRIYVRATKFKKEQDENKLVDLINKELFPTAIRGVSGISRAEAVKLKRGKEQEDGSIKIEEIYGIDVLGTNIYGLMLNTNIDPLRIISSSIGDTEKMYGIAATKKVIVRETEKVVSTNVRHPMFYADLMTRTGRVTSLEKLGLKVRERDNILGRMAMSAPVQDLVEAACESIDSRLYGISPYLMLGREPPIGTLYNDYTMDEEFIKENSKSVSDIIEML